MIKTVFSELVENQSWVILYGAMDQRAMDNTRKIEYVVSRGARS